jgi:hypothetical protein
MRALRAVRWIATLALALACTSPSVAAQYPEGAKASFGATERADADRLAAAGKPAEALATYRRAIAFHGTDASAHAGAGKMLIALRQPQQAIPQLRRAVELEPKATAYWLLLGDACRAGGDPQCAQDAYLEVLRREPNRAAYEGYRAVNGDAFSHAYDFAPGDPTATDFLPYDRSGPALVLGIGSQFGGIAGAGLEYSVQIDQFALVPHAGVGLSFPTADATLVGAVFGVMGTYGRSIRWLLDSSFGSVGAQRLNLHGAWVAARMVSGLSLTTGAERIWSSGFLLRILVGYSWITDPHVSNQGADRAIPTLSVAAGFKL